MKVKVIKRNGTIVDYDRSKIEKAIAKAGELVSINKSLFLYKFSTFKPETIADEVEDEIDDRLFELGKSEISVEEIQDIVERVLVRHNCFDAAKAYILYRERRTMVRESDPLMKLFGDLTFKDSLEVDTKRENANIDANTAMGTMLKYGSTASNFYVDHYILPKHIAKAHLNGLIHM